MDNFFEILIYLLIIISFLSGLFRKKDKKKRPPLQKPESQQPTERELSVAQSPPKEEYDVLKEIEDFFKVGDEQTETKKTRTPIEQTAEQIDFEEHVQSDSWHQPTASEHKYTDVWRKKEKERSRNKVRQKSDKAR